MFNQKWRQKLEKNFSSPSFRSYCFHSLILLVNCADVKNYNNRTPKMFAPRPSIASFGEIPYTTSHYFTAKILNLSEIYVQLLISIVICLSNLEPKCKSTYSHTHTHTDCECNKSQKAINKDSDLPTPHKLNIKHSPGSFRFSQPFICLVNLTLGCLLTSHIIPRIEPTYKRETL